MVSKLSREEMDAQATSEIHRCAAWTGGIVLGLAQIKGADSAAVAVKWGSVWSELDTILQGISNSRPLLAERVQMVNNFFADKNADPLQMICEVLPFNFH